MQCLPAGFSLATLTPIKCSSTDRVARGAPLCTDANLFAGFSTQLMKLLLHTFPRPKKEHLEAQRVERVHTCLDLCKLDSGKICTVHLALAIRITRIINLSPLSSFKTLCCHYKISRGKKTFLKAGERSAGALNLNPREMGLMSLTQSPTVNMAERGQGDTCFRSKILGLAVTGGWMDGWADGESDCCFSTLPLLFPFISLNVVFF